MDDEKSAQEIVVRGSCTIPDATPVRVAESHWGGGTYDHQEGNGEEGSYKEIDGEESDNEKVCREESFCEEDSKQKNRNEEDCGKEKFRTEVQSLGE
jgi:hypothetical protein